jgi:hypothetical protein
MIAAAQVSHAARATPLNLTTKNSFGDMKGFFFKRAIA